MKRFDEKVRDIVEVRSAMALCDDFLADPVAALNGYHFTDITADLMAKWLDRIANVKKGGGTALALAGFRGVGKSHFLAALSAIVLQPELRAGISDPHVAASAERLSRRHGVVGHVRRGSQENLFSEFQVAISQITGNSAEGCDSIAGLMGTAAAKGGDLPPLIVIDTAFGRESRVTRDDGRLLSEIAAAAKEHGVFVGLALDDDIAGADGINSSIASSFEIDYLDQEHLYKIVNAHVFSKHEKQWSLLHDIYESYRQALPGFRWSETRFSSLYPLHPAIVEIAPFVRLYLHDFALLGFAAEAGMKILGRPANSLIGLDEVFDSVEDKLRHVADLKDVFEVYDELDRKVVAAAPGMQRHEAKLILKGLFLFSLTGDGITADELAAVMLIFSDKESQASSVQGFLKSFADAMPDSVKTSGGKYILRKGSSEGDDVDTALEAAISKVSNDVVWPILRRQTAEKFVDLAPAEHDPAVATKCNVVWRGSVRRGLVVWSGTTPDIDSEWRIFVNPDPTEALPQANDAHACEWRLDKLSADDISTLKRFHVLQTDAQFRERYRESIATVSHVHLIAVEKIWQRVFLEAGYLVADKVEYRFSEEARTAHTLSQLFTLALSEYFATLYPAHPEFDEVLDDRQVSQLIENLFSGAATGNQDVQRLAADLAAPLGLVRQVDGVYSPLDATELMELPVVKALLADAPVEKNGLLRMEDLSLRMGQRPYGLTREAQHLVLAALVAQKQYEFVTSSGNRINYRSLDLQIVWNDIVGIASASDQGLSNERLLKWVAVLTGNESIRSLKGSSARTAVTESLGAWLHDWHSAGVIARFDAVPDEKLNTRLWRVGVSVRKTFGAAAEAVDALLHEATTVDHCLQTIADAFWDSDNEYVSRLVELELLKTLLDQMAASDDINDYLLVCEPTGDASIDDLRAELVEKTSPHFEGEINVNELQSDFDKFKELYAGRYAELHEGVMTSADGRLEKYLESNAWTAFSDLASTGLFGTQDQQAAMGVIRQIRAAVCAADVRDVLQRQPHCNCTFSMPDAKDVDMLIEELSGVVEAGLKFFQARLSDESVANALGEDGSAALEFIKGGSSIADLPAGQMQGLKKAIFGAAGKAVGDRRSPTRRSDAALDADDVEELTRNLDNLGPA